jgi:hypothetical protein
MPSTIGDEPRKLENAVLAVHSLQFWTVNRIDWAFGSRQMREIVGMPMRAVAMSVPIARAKVKP